MRLLSSQSRILDQGGQQGEDESQEAEEPLLVLPGGHIRCGGQNGCGLIHAVSSLTIVLSLCRCSRPLFLILRVLLASEADVQVSGVGMENV